MLGKPEFVCTVNIEVDGVVKKFGFLTTDCENPEGKADWILAEMARNQQRGKLISVTIEPTAHSQPRAKGV